MSVRITNLTLTGDGRANVAVYRLDGHEQDATFTPTAGNYRFPVPAGKYRIAVSFGAFVFDDGKDRFGPNSAGFFYRKSGPTTSWSKATTVTVSAGRTTSLTVKAHTGTFLSGTIIGHWNNDMPDSPEVIMIPWPVAPKDARFLMGVSPQVSISRDGNKTHHIEMPALLPGTYVFMASNLLGGKSRYYVGNGKPATADITKAKRFKVTSTAKHVVNFGTFKTGT